jgi:transcriptional regulator with PAS, ATPase and Fis domain
MNADKSIERQLDNCRIGEFVTRSQEMLKILEFIALVADASATVMIYGETGTGKELIAGYIHEKGRGSDKPFVTIDCTALSENLLASELFGHEKGAFTSAIDQKRGLFEIANGGTVFLDEIGELPLNLQAMILKVIESKTFRRVGGETYRATDVQIIGATNRDLKQFVAEKRFRKDLYYRLNVVPVYIPPLRKRREDILPLIEHFIRHFNKKIGRNVIEVSHQALKNLIDYHWPGNIRELRNIIEYMVIVSKGRVIDLESLPLEIRGSMPAPVAAFLYEPESDTAQLPDFREAKAKLIADFEENYLRQILSKNRGNVSECAREMKMHRSSFQRFMRKHKIDNAS